MKLLLAAALALLPATVLAQQPAAPADGFNARVIARYCDKLREGPEPYVQFVRRMYTVHGYTYSDFVPGAYGGPAKFDCKVSPARLAEVRRVLAQAKP